MTTLKIARRPRRAAKIGGAVLAAGLAGVLATGMITWSTSSSAALPAQGYADLVEKVSPAVVFISSTHTPAESQTMPGQGQQMFPFALPPGSPFEDFFKRLQPRPSGPVTALGSGFLIDPDGDIVTNNHVVDGADEIKIRLQDGREFEAKVVGTDPKTDLALLHIQSDDRLPFVAFGDSESLRIGDIVLAVGNPFGLGGTVTAGIVSARNRDIHAGYYDDFIQTDAAINHGNSGGPLFNTDGQVVGVNSAIFSPNGGSVGIGFAIPANLTKDVVTQIKDHGRVERGWLGVSIQAVTPDVAEALGLAEPHGALVAEVTPDSPAAKAGVKPGDVIVDFAGKPVKAMRDLPRLVAATGAGETASVEVLRDGRSVTLSATIGALDPDVVAAAATPQARPNLAQTLGAKVAPLDDALRARLRLPDNASGVVITALAEAGPAARAGLRPGDLIERVGPTTIGDPGQLRQALSAADGNVILLMIRRDGSDRFVGVKLAQG